MTTLCDRSKHRKTSSKTRRAVLACAGIALNLLPAGRSADASGQSTALAPPFRPAWSQTALPQITKANVSGGTVRFAGPYDVGAFDLATGKPTWQHKDEKHPVVGAAEFDDTAVYSALYEYGIEARAAKTGHLLWSMPVKCSIYDLLVDRGKLFCELHSGKIAALNTVTHGMIWETSLSPTSSPLKFDTEKITLLGSNRLLVSATTKQAGTDTGVFQIFCLSRDRGRILWRSQPIQERDDWALGRTADARRMYVAFSGQSVLCISLRDGKTLWRREGAGTEVITNAGRLFAVNGGKVQALDCATGKPLWALTLSRALEANVSAPVVAGSDVWVISDDTLYALTADGHIRWKWTQADFGPDFIPTERGFLARAANSLCLFQHGEPDRLPADTVKRQRMAQSLVARLDTLTVNDQNNLLALGDDAFPALIAELRKRMLAYLATPKQFELYSSFSDCAKFVASFAKPKFTPQLLELLRLAKPVEGDQSVRQEILGILASKGDTRLTLPLFIDILKSEAVDWTYRFSAGYVALETVKRSGDPAATAYLLSVLADDKADPELRHVAFENVARTGNPSAIKAVLAIRSKHAAATPLADVMMLSELPQSTDEDKGSYISRLVATAKDDHGQLWGLVKSVIAGSYDDLWIVRSEGGRWTDPIFTTLSLKQLGKPAQFIRYVSDARFRIDTDGDGWTDLLEKRLGTNPSSKDTDNDGIDDAADINPLTPARPLTETEQVLSAAFQAKNWSGGPVVRLPWVVSFPKGNAAFELMGSSWIILGKKDGTASPLDELWNHGPAFVSFRPPNLDFDGSQYNPKAPNSTVLWNKEHTRARVSVSVYYGGLNGTGSDIELRKFGNDWVVVSDDVIIMS